MRTTAKLLAAAAVALFAACGPRTTGGGSTTAVRDTMKIAIDPDRASSMRLLLDNEQRAVQVPRDDIRALAGYFADAEYDTVLNDSGIMVKMVAPDHTIVVSYRDPGVPDDRLQIWSVPGRVHFGHKWFWLRGADLEGVIGVLQKLVDSGELTVDG